MANSDIQYLRTGALMQNIRVYLVGKHIGTIKPVTNGFAYFPLGSRTKGETRPTPEAIKRDLEEM